MKLFLGMALAALAQTTLAGETTLAPNHPDRYTVVKGDTLWDISARFLNDPWLWPKVWKRNTQIKNPHLIYPGDVIVLSLDENGAPALRVLRKERRTVRLSPTVRREPLVKPIPTIPPGAILPYLSRPLVLEKGEIEKAGYVTVGLDDKLVLGKYSEFYARGLGDASSRSYELFRAGKALIDPDSEEVLGYEAVHLGTALMMAPGDPAKLRITDSKQEIGPGDRLLPTPPEAPLPYYLPRAPEGDVRGRILSIYQGVREVGPTAVVALNLGRRDGIEPGHVLRIRRHASKRLDPVTRKNYELPEEDSGLLMVFRTFDKVSYALILTAARPVQALDAVQTP